MKKQRRVYFFPRTEMGMISFLVVVISFIGIYLQYWLSISGLLNLRLPLSGFLMGGAIVGGGIISIISIVKYRDYAIFLFLSSLIGILGILFVIGEFAFPH